MRRHWLDDLAKSIAGGMPRRSFVKGLAALAGGAAFAGFRPAAAQSTCHDICAARGLSGQAFGNCMQDCQTGATFVCESDANCFHTGCSGQICASEDVITTCEFRCEYACYQQAECACLGQGRCGFVMTQELQECLRVCQQAAH